jgi:hypothetical protein
MRASRSPPAVSATRCKLWPDRKTLSLDVQTTVTDITDTVYRTGSGGPRGSVRMVPGWRRCWSGPGRSCVPDLGAVAHTGSRQCGGAWARRGSAARRVVTLPSESRWSASMGSGGSEGLEIEPAATALDDVGDGTLADIPKAGWYPDPSQPRQERYGSGSQWSTQVRPAHSKTPRRPRVVVFRRGRNLSLLGWLRL